MVMNLQSINKKAQVAARSCVVLTALVLPFSTAALNILPLLAVLCWLAGGTVRADLTRLFKHPLTLPILLFVMWAAVTAVWAVVPLDMSLEALRKYRKYICLLLLLVIMNGDTVWRDRTLNALYLSLIVLCFLCVGIALGVPGLPKMDPYQGAIMMKNHITQGFLMAILCVLAVWKMKYADVLWQRIVGVLAFILPIFVTFYLTNGRTGYVCVAAAVGFAALWFVPTAKLKIGVVAALMIAMVGVFFTSDRIQTRVAEIGTDIEQYEKGNNQTSSGLRLTYWSRSMQMFKENPVGGVGIGSWGYQYCKMEPENIDNPQACKNVRIGNSHNEFLMVLSQYGIVGFALFIWLLVRSGICGVGLDDVGRWLFFGFYSTFLVGCLFNSFIWDVTEGGLFMLMLGTMLGIPLSAQLSQRG